MAIFTTEASKGGKKPRSRARRSNGGRGIPRIMWVAIAVCVIGAVVLFRDQSSDIPTGIGERQTVVTAMDIDNTLAANASPRSGDVDIDEQAAKLTPERPRDGTTAPVEKDPAPVPKKPAPKQAVTPPAPPVQPMKIGPYMVQVGSFGDADNADKEATRLKDKGLDARVKVGNTSDGSLIFRVRIGYFKSRSEAELFIRQNRKDIAGAIAVHR
jgi:cell division septation protein DedD